MRSKKIDDLKNAFPEWEKHKNPCEEKKGLDEIKYEDVKRIVSGPAYRDFSPRTLKGVTKESTVVEGSLEWLSNEICDYIKKKTDNTETAFDDWHKDTCEEFKKKFNNAAAINYGKAQKILNMTFKYLFCLYVSEDDEINRFKFCHMPLDTYTLYWFCDVVWESIRKAEDFAPPESISTVTKIKDISWSNLDYGAYVWIQEQIREYLKGENNIKYVDEQGQTLTPFMAEFYIWPEQQLVEACKPIKKLTVCAENYPKYSDEEIRELCNATISRILRAKF